MSRDTTSELRRAARHLAVGELADAEAICRDIVQRDAANAPALRLLAAIGMRLGQYRDAAVLLARCVELAPADHRARTDYVHALHRSRRFEEALAELDVLEAAESGAVDHLLLRAAILVEVGRVETAIAIYESVLARDPDQARVQLSHGHALRSLGRSSEAIAAYRRAIAVAPGLGEAYWSLANLKTFRFTADEMARMRARLDAGPDDATDHYHLRFALGKALEDGADYGAAFAQYQRGNEVRRERLQWDAARHEDELRRHRALFDAAFFEARAGAGCPAPDPIFVVGLPRAGSTLLEQILASHSQVDGTMELPDVIAIARRLAGLRRRGERSRYPEVVARVAPEQLADLGAQYLDRTRVHRGAAPFFVDKMPNNFVHIGLIHLMLPNAKIIDARRHPMGCCLSAFKQLFAAGQTYSYDLEELGRYYRDYAALMAHWDEVLPGRVLRVRYEDVVSDLEGQVRRLLDHCGLPFEQSCLDFHATDRAVQTASSAQVREPIYMEGTDHWRHFEPYLDVLADTLGPLVDTY